MSTEDKNSTSPGYEVGHCRPPVHSRFQKGQSGNPRGRRSREKSMPAAVLKALHSKVVVTENGERKSVPRIEVAARQLANKAAAGDLHAIRLIADLCPEVKEEVGSVIQLNVSDDDMHL
jgi:Family of unknown function (DUF5681)